MLGRPVARVNPAPVISVVMGTYNGAQDLPATIDSLLGQDHADFELIIVDDGSTDGSARVLSERAAADSRIRVVRQDNQGLTRALILGCQLARGRYIARQDCGDLSSPGRLAAELAVLAGAEDVAMVSCATRFVGPAGEPLYDVVIDQKTAQAGLTALTLQEMRGPAHHGGTMFRRDLYERVGGYRKEFYFAQDLDLWTRMAELGRHVALPEILYQATFALGSISGLNRHRQIACTRVILECAQLRRTGQSESLALEKALAIRPNGQTPTAAERAAALYFVGACLRKLDDPRARNYFRQALHVHPLHMKSALRLLLG